MRNTTVIGFLATIAIAVPAGWHLLDADLQKDGKLVRPLQGVANIDEATTVSIDADHAIAAPGGRVKVTLVATSDRPHPVAVEMAVMIEGSVGPEERIPNPLITVDRERFVLPAGPGGGKPVETYVKLGKQLRSKGAGETYRIFVSAPKTNLPDNESSVDPNPDTREFAGIGVLTWSGNRLPLSIEAPKTIEKGKPFEVALHLKNTSNHTLHWAWFELGSRVTLRGISEHSDDIEIDRDENESETDLAPGKELVRKFTVTAKRDGAPVSLLARAYVNEREPQPGGSSGWSGGAMDVVRVAVGSPAVASN